MSNLTQKAAQGRLAYRSNLPAVVGQLRLARTAGLAAAAEVLLEAVRRALAGGFTSGAFETGQLVESVGRSEPEPDAGRIYVGTKWFYALAWELGHINVFTRRFERREVWMPAFLDQRTAMQLAYARAFRQVMGT